MDRIGVRRSTVLVLAASLAVAGAAIPAAAAAGRAPLLSVTRDGRDAVVKFDTRVAGEELAAITAAAPGASWSTEGAEAAVLRVSVDGAYATDDVVMAAAPNTRSFDLGTLAAGAHVLRLHFDTEASAPSTDAINVEPIEFHTVPATSGAYVALSHSPILYGRNGDGVNPHESGPYQNAVTDTPLVAWHENTAATTPGDRILKYSIIWSNEDGGTSTPALMARWGRTTDIEWIYQVEVDGSGHTVKGTAVFQSPDHGTTQFAGTYEGDRPRLQTCTLNNNVCDTVDDPMRFSLSTAETLHATTQAREQVMDANPWTYHVMAEEMRREGRVVVDPRERQTMSIADPDNYVYLVVRKRTLGSNSGVFWVGVAIGVRLKGDSRLFRSDQRLHPDWSLQRDDPAATTVELPPGTKPSDIAKIEAIRVHYGTDTGVPVEMQGINRAFFLGSDDQPKPSFLSAATPARLTEASPIATLYTAP